MQGQEGVLKGLKPRTASEALAREDMAASASDKQFVRTVDSPRLPSRFLTASWWRPLLFGAGGLRRAENGPMSISAASANSPMVQCQALSRLALAKNRGPGF